MSLGSRVAGHEFEKLPVHGFVLAGGKSSRMGVDKATLEFRGRALVEIAVEKLREFCEDVSIVGNREDLRDFGEVVEGEREDFGPGAGIEAGLKAARWEWAMFVPVDVPLVPVELLRLWAEAVLGHSRGECGVSFLLVRGERQPSFCMVRRDGLTAVSGALDRGERRLDDLLDEVDRCEVGWIWIVDAVRCVTGGMPTDARMGYWFSNLNTPPEFDEAEVGDADPLRG